MSAARTSVPAVGGSKLARRVAAGAAGLALGGLVLTAPAHAATTVGQTSPTFTCGSGTGQVQTSTAGPPTYTIPSDGVITSFTAGSDTGSGATTLLILQPLSGTTYNVAAKATGPHTTIGLTTFPVQIPVQAERVIGSYGNPCAFSADPADVFHQFSGGEPAVGADQSFPNPTPGFRINLSATLEPDCDGDQFGDETQDSDTSSCTPSPPTQAGRTLTLNANKNKVKKGKKVTLSGRLDAPGNEAACESGQTVELQRKKPSQTAFTTLEQLGTDAAGNFSTKEKVKKTFEYRAQVPETATCNGKVSNTEKVKVKKPK